MRWTVLALGVLLGGCGDDKSAGEADGADSARVDALDSLPMPDDSATDSAPPAEEGPSHLLLITELMADNDDTLVDGAGGSPDWIELFNPGPEAVDLTGFTLSDDPDEPGGAFSEDVLQPGAFVVVYADGEALPFKLSADGETVVLRDAAGALVDQLDFGGQRTDVSFGRHQDVASEVLLADGDTARFAAGAPAGWSDPSTDDTDWTEVVLPIGFDTAHPLSNELALFGATTQSSNGYGYTGVQAVDGDLSTFSHTGDADLSAWWAVDLGSSAELTEVVLHNRRGCCPERLYNLVVEVLDAASTSVWRSELLHPVAEGSAPTSPGDQITVAIEPPVTGRHVRVEKTAVNGAYSSEWLSFGEVEVTGVLQAPYDDRIQTDVGDALAGGEGVVRVGVPAAALDAQAVRLELVVDDGYEAWLDGVRVGMDNLDPAVAVQADAPLVLTLPPSDADGSLLAVRLVDADGEDALLGLTLTALSIDTPANELRFFPTPTPGGPNVDGLQGYVDAPGVDPPRGWLEAATDVTVRFPEDAVLVYTLDGTIPSEDNGIRVEDGPLDLRVEHTTLLRAVALQEGWGDSAVVTHTWLFMDDVVGQPAAPDGLPTTWAGLSQPPVAADYEMDPEVVLDPAYADDLRRGLRAIPALSIVMDPDDLWGEADGIYVHSTQRGDSWERPTSMELLQTDGASFQADCGVRVHGYGWRPHSATLKHSLRLEFRSRYGATKLDHPLFPDAPVDRFDSIVLRSQGSRGWQDFRDPEQAQYIRDAFARDTAAAMGKADGHAAYVHLFLNGLYWGLYMAVERPDADFGAERFGGDDSEYDAVNRRTTTNEAIDGSLDAYNHLLALSDADLTDTEAYAAVAEMIDIDDLVDYMLIHQYTSNRDGPEQFSHNNMRGVRRRLDGERFRFFVWDMEYSLWSATDHINIDVDVAGSVSHVYARLRSNPDFRAHYAERAAVHLDGGALSAEACLARWEARAEEIEDAVVAESARWGDTDRAVPYTRDVEWAEERRRLTEAYFPQRTDVLIEQLRAAGLY